MPKREQQSVKRRLPPLAVALLYAVAAGLWIVSSAKLTGIVASTPETLKNFETLKGLAFVAITSLILYLVLRARDARTSEEIAPPSVGKWPVIGLVLATLVVPPLVGFMIVRVSAPGVETQARDDLQASIEGRVSSIALWIEERHRDIQATSDNRFFLSLVKALQASPNASPAAISLNAQLHALRAAYDYQSVALVASDGSYALTANPRGEPPGPVNYYAAIPKDLSPGDTVIASTACGDRTCVDFIGALVSQDRERRHLGYLVLRTTPEQIAAQGAPANRARFESQATAMFVLTGGAPREMDLDDSANQSSIAPQPGVRQELVAALQQTNTDRGFLHLAADSDASQLAYYQRIPRLNWFLATTVNREEAMQPLHRLGLWVSISTFFTLAIVVCMLTLMWRQQRDAHSRSLIAASDQHEKALQAREKAYYDIFLAMPHPIWVYDLESLSFLAVNDAAIKKYGYSREEFLAMSIEDIRPPQQLTEFRAHLERKRGHSGSYSGIWQHITRRGELLDVEVSTYSLRFGNRNARLVLAYDITQRLRDQAEVRKLNSYYAALSEINNVIFTATDADTLLNRVCELTSRYTCLELVSINRIEDGYIVPGVARHGRSADSSRGFTNDQPINIASGKGINALAAREQRTLVVNDFSTDAITRDWQRGPLSKRMRAATACPLMRGGNMWGVIAFFADQKNYFSEDLVQLLEEIAADVSYSLDMLDIQQRQRESEAQLRLHASIIESTHDGLYITDSDHRFVMVNQAIVDMTGYDKEELLSDGNHSIIDPSVDPGHYKEIRDRLLENGHWQGELVSRRKNGEIFPAHASITRVFTPDRADHHFVTVFRDITERKQYEQRIHHLANHDVLTGLANRAMLQERFEIAASRARRDGNSMALLFIDLDRFKLINDTLGHEYGDGLLKEVARRIGDQVRPGDTASRVGGDEFVVLLSRITSLHHAEDVGRRLLRAVSEPCMVDNHELVVTASIGIALYPDHAATLDGLRKMADHAMLDAKHAGQNRLHIYSGEMGKTANRYLQLLNALRNAIPNEEMHLVFQPQLDMRDKSTIGVEALARWHSPEYGNIPPGQFIPMAEDSGLIVDIGHWILVNACRQARQWLDLGLIDFPISVNVSALQFRQPDFVDIVGAVLAETGLPAANLELEVTESVLMTDADDVLKKLTQLRTLGTQLAIDDFGTGYSSLSYLHRFAPRRIKVDKSFVKDLPHDRDGTAITRAVVSLSENLGVEIIAEGVESPDQAQFLTELGCHYGQGYLYSRPVDREGLEQWLAQGPAVRHLGQASL